MSAIVPDHLRWVYDEEEGDEEGAGVYCDEAGVDSCRYSYRLRLVDVQAKRYGTAHYRADTLQRPLNGDVLGHKSVHIAQRSSFVTYQPLVLLFGVRELYVGCSRPQKATRQAQNSPRQEREPRIACPVEIPEPTTVQRVADGANHQTQLRSEGVEDTAPEEAYQGEQAVEDGIGLVCHVCRRRPSSSGA